MYSVFSLKTGIPSFSCLVKDMYSVSEKMGISSFQSRISPFSSFETGIPSFQSSISPKYGCSSRWIGLATVSRIDQIIGLFCRILSLLKVSFAEESYNLIDPTNCRHPILTIVWLCEV